MPPNKPGRDIIILEPGRAPGAGSSVCERVYVRALCVYVRPRARRPGSLGPHHHGVSQPQPAQTRTVRCLARRTFPSNLVHATARWV